MHGDVKSENVLVSRNSDGHWTAKVCDRGYAMQHQALHEGQLPHRGTLTNVALEILQNKPYDTSVDMWAFAVLLTQLVHRDCFLYSPVLLANRVLFKKHLERGNSRSSTPKHGAHAGSPS